VRLGWFSNSWFLDVFWGRKGGDKEGWLLGRGGDNGVVMREGGGCWGNGGGGGCGRAREYVYKKRKYYKIEVYNFFNASNALPPSPILS